MTSKKTVTCVFNVFARGTFRFEQGESLLGFDQRVADALSATPLQIDYIQCGFDSFTCGDEGHGEPVEEVCPSSSDYPPSPIPPFLEPL